MPYVLSEVVPESHGSTRAALISSASHVYSLLRCDATNTNTRLVYRAACLFTPQIPLVLSAPTHGGLARLS